MRKLLIIFINLFLVTMYVASQTSSDTLIMYSGNNLSGGRICGNNYPAYTIDNKPCSEEQAKTFNETFMKLSNNSSVYFVKTFDLNNKLLSITQQKGFCLNGIYREFHENGKLKIKGQYRILSEAEEKKIKAYPGYNTDCRSWKNGIWLYYDKKGIIIKKEIYKNGDLIK